MNNPFLLARDTVNGAEGTVILTIDGKNIVVAGMKNVTTNAEIQSEPMRQVGTNITQQKVTGVAQTGKGNIYYGYDLFRQMVLDYINDGIMREFSLQLTNDDPATTIGPQTLVYYGCYLTGTIPLSIFDSEDKMLNYDFEFTWTRVAQLQAFKAPAKLG